MKKRDRKKIVRPDRPPKPMPLKANGEEAAKLANLINNAHLNMTSERYVDAAYSLGRATEHLIWLRERNRKGGHPS